MCLHATIELARSMHVTIYMLLLTTPRLHIHSKSVKTSFDLGNVYRLVKLRRLFFSRTFAKPMRKAGYYEITVNGICMLPAPPLFLSNSSSMPVTGLSLPIDVNRSTRPGASSTLKSAEHRLMTAFGPFVTSEMEA